MTGTAGTLSHSSSEERNYTTDYPDASMSVQLTPASDPVASPYFLELQEFVRALDGGPNPRVSIADGVAAVRIANAALQSLHSGQPVTIAAAERSLA